MSVDQVKILPDQNSRQKVALSQYDNNEGVAAISRKHAEVKATGMQAVVRRN
jgi:hypothetical protein